MTFARDLTELNDVFIGLLADGAELGCPDALRQRVAVLDTDRRRELAALPFALFGLGFGEEGAWTTLLSPCVRDLEPGYVAARAPAERFTLIALSTLRTCLRTAPRLTSAWIGLPSATGTRLADLDIGLLAPVAACAAPRLRVRRALRETMWVQLVDAIERRDARQLVVLGALGRQWSIRRSLGITLATAGSRGYRC